MIFSRISCFISNIMKNKFHKNYVKNEWYVFGLGINKLHFLYYNVCKSDLMYFYVFQ